MVLLSFIFVQIRVFHHSKQRLTKPASSTPPVFACPEQPDLQLPLSRIDDGICDCCDGADESPDVCPIDTCAAIRQAREAERTALQTAYTHGSAVRAEAIAKFASVKEKNDLEIRKIESEKLPLLRDQQLPEAERAFAEFKSQHFAHRLQSRGPSATFHDELWQGINTASELVDLIVALCQVAGELSTESSSTTCTPLRQAGLDAGLLWNEAGELLQNEATTQDAADLVYYNAVSSRPVYKISDMKNTKASKSKNKRKLLYVAADDDVDYYDDYEDHDYYGDDDFVDHHNDYDGEQDVEESERTEEGSKRDVVLDAIRETEFSSSRVKFLEQADILLGKIKEVEEGQSRDDGESDADETETPTKEDEATNVDGAASSPDPAIIAQVRKELEARIKTVERGLSYAASAKVLLNDVADIAQLRTLASGVVFYAHLSSFVVYQALVASLEGFTIPSFEVCTTSLAAVWCPLQTIAREGSVVPADVLAGAVQALCQSETLETESGTCAETNTSESIPDTIPDGYFGYFSLEEREASDPLHKFLEDSYVVGAAEDSSRQKAIEADEKLQSVMDDISQNENQVKDLRDEIGGNEGPKKFGDDGELFSIKDECFDVVAGKYIYEICLFGKAAQKDVDKPKAAGTSLGQWTKATKETKTDRQGHEYTERVWKWEKGTKCWNGPQRSATAYVKCGSETVVLSADEPDTCRYVMQVASPVACDEEHRVRHNLS